MDLSAGSLFGAMVVSTVGFGLFLYGKKQARIPQLVVGIALMTFPYFVGGLVWLTGIALGLIAGMWAAVRAGL